MVKTIPITTWSEFLRFLADQSYDAAIGRYRSKYLYRGLQDAGYFLETTLQRNCKEKKDVIESCILRNCKNRHPSPICTRFEHHLAGGLAPLSRTEAPLALSHFWASLPVRCRNRTLSDMCTEF